MKRLALILSILAVLCQPAFADIFPQLGRILDPQRNPVFEKNLEKPHFLWSSEDVNYLQVPSSSYGSTASSWELSLPNSGVLVRETHVQERLSSGSNTGNVEILSQSPMRELILSHRLSPWWNVETGLRSTYGMGAGYKFGVGFGEVYGWQVRIGQGTGLQLIEGVLSSSARRFNGASGNRNQQIEVGYKVVEGISWHLVSLHNYVDPQRNTEMADYALFDNDGDDLLGEVTIQRESLPTLKLHMRTGNSSSSFQAFQDGLRMAHFDMFGKAQEIGVQIERQDRLRWNMWLNLQSIDFGGTARTYPTQENALASPTFVETSANVISGQSGTTVGYAFGNFRPHFSAALQILHTTGNMKGGELAFFGLVPRVQDTRDLSLSLTPVLTLGTGFDWSVMEGVALRYQLDQRIPATMGGFSHRLSLRREF